MKKHRYIAATALLLVLAAPLVMAQEDIALHPRCAFCGMDRAMYNYSRVFIQFTDGSTEGTCSIHCAAVSLALNLDKSPTTIWVADYATKQFVDAEQAFWVIGGSKAGVMSARGKWAFTDQAAATTFIAANGGAPATFAQAIKGAYEDMYADTMMIRERRAAKRKAMEQQKKDAATAANP